MVQGREEERTVLLGALQIAAVQKSVVASAQAISLEAMNAKSLVSRAGEGARAIRPLTDQIDEFARHIISLIQEIRTAAVDVCRHTLAAFTEQIVAGHLKKAADLGRNSKFIGGADGTIASVNTSRNEIKARALHSFALLARLLEDIDTDLLAATVVVSKFRLEAGAIGGSYKANFDSLIEKLDVAVGQSRASIASSEKVLNDCVRVLGRK